MERANSLIDSFRKMGLYASMSFESVVITPYDNEFNSQTQVNSIKNVQNLIKERAYVAKIYISEKDEKKIEQCIEHINYINGQIKLILGL